MATCEKQFVCPSCGQAFVVTEGMAATLRETGCVACRSDVSADDFVRAEE
ncbi:DUF7560 family zinc ribbon protein [Halalkalirubrum salinum]|nr:zinc ribbon domain-containing protein [Halalkalirubrum salinum]